MGLSPATIARTPSKTEFEITSIMIQQFLVKKKYDKVIETLRGLTGVHILKCLVSFPFNDLNQAIPESFLIWETLMVKLQNSEGEGYIAKVPHAACHDLVSRTGAVLAYLEKHSNPDLYFQCRRVLKKLYMHYPEITDHLMKENEHLSRALHTLTLHIPLGIDSSAITLQQAIQDEVTASLIDLKDAIEHLEELPFQLSSNVSNGIDSGKVNGKNSMGHHSLTQRQIQERLYFNQCILRGVSPCRRKDNLSQLQEMLQKRIQGDKDVLALFANLRQHHQGLGEVEPVEPKLRHQHHMIECAIAMLQEIKNELAINRSPPASPPASQFPTGRRGSSDSFTSTELVSGYPLASAVSLDHSQFSRVLIQQDKVSTGIGSRGGIAQYRSSSEKQLQNIRPMSASTVMQHRNRQANHGPGINPSCVLIDKQISSSNQELFSASSSPPLPVVAGVKKKGGFIRRSLRGSIKRLSSSTGNVSNGGHKTKGKSIENDSTSALLEIKNQELLEARETIATLRRRERELTDRLSEQAQRHLRGSEHFEDILMGANRPSLVVQRFSEIYSQERIEAYDFIVDTTDIEDDMLISTFLLDILKFSYIAAKCSLESLHNGWKRSLGIQERPDTDDREMNAIRQLETAVSVFIRKVPASYEHIKEINKMVYWDIEKQYSSLPFYQSIIKGLYVESYIDECAQLSWELVIQSPPMVLKYNETEYSVELHTRFHSANGGSDIIIGYQWPTLVHETSGVVLSRGIVVT